MKRIPGSREEHSWFTDRQLAGLTPADQSDLSGSPIPTQVVSNGEYLPMPQTREQKRVEARIQELAAASGKKLGMSRRRFLASAGGMAAALIAMNEVFGRFFKVDPVELLEPEAFAAAGPPADLFVFDDQLHMIRNPRGMPPGFANPRALRAVAQGPGPASGAAGFKHNPFNPEGYPDELGSPWSSWNPALGQAPNEAAQFELHDFVKAVFLDSQTNVGLLSNAPLSLFAPPGMKEGSKPINIQQSLETESLSGYQTASVRDFVNAIAGSTRLLAHGQLYPGVGNLDFIQQQIGQFHPDAWKGYCIAYSAKIDNNPLSPFQQWRLDDEKVAYPMYEVIRKNDQELRHHRGFFNLSIHKGLATVAPDTPERGNPSDIPKAARDWPDFNFIIYHSCYGPAFFDYESLQEIRSGKLVDGVPNLRWTTQFCQLSRPLKNVYADLGTTFASCVVTFPTVCAHLMGQLVKYLGPERICFGTDAMWYGGPQWQIEALWRFQIPEKIAKKYDYPELTESTKRKILGLNAARLYGMPAPPQIPQLAAAYKPVPADFAAKIPPRLEEILSGPGFPAQQPPPAVKQQAKELAPPADRLAELREDYRATGGTPSNRRYGWIRRS